MDSAHSRCSRFTGKSLLYLYTLFQFTTDKLFVWFSLPFSQCFSISMRCARFVGTQIGLWSVCFVFEQIIEFQRFRSIFFYFFLTLCPILMDVVVIFFLHSSYLKYIKSDYRASKQSKESLQWAFECLPYFFKKEWKKKCERIVGIALREIVQQFMDFLRLLDFFLVTFLFRILLHNSLAIFVSFCGSDGRLHLHHCCCLLSFSSLYINCVDFIQLLFISIDDPTKMQTRN